MASLAGNCHRLYFPSDPGIGGCGTPSDSRGQRLPRGSAGFLMWLAMALYTKWNWGISLADKEIKKRNNRQMIMILFLMFFLATTLK